MAQVGLKDLHFATLTEDSVDTLSYATPEPLVGAINATISPSVNTQEVYADDQLWESVSALGKIDVEIETADLPLVTRAKILGNKIEDGVLIENKSDIPPHIALGFRSQKSNGKFRYVWLLKGIAQPINYVITSATIFTFWVPWPMGGTSNLMLGLILMIGSLLGGTIFSYLGHYEEA